MTAFEERVARNEVLFREVNERVQELARRSAADQSEPPGFICECANAECVDHVDVPLSVYEQVRTNPRRFIVLPGHVLPGLEHIVEQAADYAIVEKDTTAGVQISEQHDPRS